MSTPPEQTLRNKGIRPTAMRLLVLRYLEEQPYAVSLNTMEAEMAPTDRITLYRTLRTFREKGLVHSIDDGTGATKFALCPESCTVSAHQDLHIHFYCDRCRQTYCLPKNRVPELSLPAGFLLHEVNLMAKGLCETCRR